MLINLRNALMTRKRTPTARDYVQSGLVAMWDGVENAGWGTHDASNRMLNLVSGEHFGNISGGTIAQDNLYTTARLTSSASSNLSDYMTIEFCVDYTNPDSQSRSVFFFPSSSTAKAVGAYSFNSNFPLRIFRTITWENFSVSGNRFANTIAVAFRKASGRTSSQMLYCLGYGGEYLKTAQDTGGDAGYAIDNSGILYLGASGLQMKIHSIRLYSRALTADEIATNYAIDKERFNLP